MNSSVWRQRALYITFKDLERNSEWLNVISSRGGGRIVYLVFPMVERLSNISTSFSKKGMVKLNIQDREKPSEIFVVGLQHEGLKELIIIVET